MAHATLDSERENTQLKELLALQMLENNVIKDDCCARVAGAERDDR